MSNSKFLYLDGSMTRLPPGHLEYYRDCRHRYYEVIGRHVYEIAEENRFENHDIELGEVIDYDCVDVFPDPARPGVILTKPKQAAVASLVRAKVPVKLATCARFPDAMIEGMLEPRDPMDMVIKYYEQAEELREFFNCKYSTLRIVGDQGRREGGAFGARAPPRNWENPLIFCRRRVKAAKDQRCAPSEMKMPTPKFFSAYGLVGDDINLFHFDHLTEHVESLYLDRVRVYSSYNNASIGLVNIVDRVEHLKCLTFIFTENDKTMADDDMFIQLYVKLIGRRFDYIRLVNIPSNVDVRIFISLRKQ